jgi:2'-5' RNA ligase
MPTALTLALDQEGRETFDDFWAALDGLGIGDPSRRLDHPAHLTLAVVAEDIEEMEEAALALPAPRSLRLTHLGLFTMPSEVLFLAPLVTAELLETQRRAVAALEGYTLHEHSRPGAWVPHVTLAHLVFGARDLHAFGRIDLPLDVGIAAVELVSFPPAWVVARHPLG